MGFDAAFEAVAGSGWPLFSHDSDLEVWGRGLNWLGTFVAFVGVEWVLVRSSFLSKAYCDF